MWFFARVPPHMNNKHVLRLEGFFLPRAPFPPANKALFIHMNVVSVDMLDQVVLRGELDAAVFPMAVGLDEVRRLILQVTAVWRLRAFTGDLRLPLYPMCLKRKHFG